MWAAELGNGTTHVTLCNFHVSRAILKNLLAHVKDPEVAGQILRDCQKLMYGRPPAGYSTGQYIKATLHSFSSRWKGTAPAFVEYMEKQWAPCAGEFACMLGTWCYRIAIGARSLSLCVLTVFTLCVVQTAG